METWTEIIGLLNIDVGRGKFKIKRIAGLNWKGKKSLNGNAVVVFDIFYVCDIYFIFILILYLFVKKNHHRNIEALE